MSPLFRSPSGIGVFLAAITTPPPTTTTTTPGTTTTTPATTTTTPAPTTTTTTPAPCYCGCIFSDGGDTYYYCGNPSPCNVPCY